ncbi:class F sortase [Candidatus Kaiserbacteria bacterium]|nr:class F sortase [Candidatus Kaiserbacteria bacterium]
MARRYALPAAAGIVTVLALFVFADTLIGALWYAPDTEVRAPEPDDAPALQQAAPADRPSRLFVPKLGIDAYVQHVGVNASGNMAAPNNFTDVGWYKYGTVPGFMGSAVVTGHVDNALGLPGVFKDLDQLVLGDEMVVESESGASRRFRVVEIQRYPYALVPRKILFSRGDVPRLNLITCSGRWLQGERSYDERLVVYAELVS